MKLRIDTYNEFTGIWLFRFFATRCTKIKIIVNRVTKSVA